MKKTRVRTRSICLLLALIFMLTAIAAGCTAISSKDTGSGTGKSEDASSEKTEPTLKPVELLWYFYEIPENLPELKSVINEMNKIIQPKINATIKIQVFDAGSYANKIKLSIQSGEVFDLCFTSNWMNPYTENASQGAYVALDDLLDTYGKNVKSAIPEKYWDVTRIGGKIYGMLNYQVFASRNGFKIKKDLADKYGLDINSLNKISDIEPFLEQIKNNEPDLYPVFGTSFPAFFDPNTGARLDLLTGDDRLPIYVASDDPTFTVKNYAESDSYKERVERARDWFLKGYVRKDALTAWKNEKPDLAAGKYAVILNEGTMKPGYLEEFKNNYGYEVLGKPMYTQVASSGSILGTLTAVSSSSKNPERAVMFYDLIYSDPKLYNTLIYGIENKNYKMVAENVVEVIPDTGYKFSNQWEVGNQFNAFYRVGDTIGKWEETIKYNAAAEVSPIISFSFNPEPVKSEIAQISAVAAEFDPQINVGLAEIDKIYPTYLEQLKAAGIDKVIEEAQKQIDAWKAKK